MNINKIFFGNRLKSKWDYDCVTSVCFDPHKVTVKGPDGELPGNLDTKSAFIGADGEVLGDLVIKF